MGKKSGFTLVELSIVLVIIGLIVGGIVGGQSLIASANRQALLKQVGSYRAAIRTFELQYDALPGDFIEAIDYWPADTISGDGNGGIAKNATVFFRRENLLVWQHLSLAEVLSDASEGVISGNTIYAGRNIPTAQGFGGYMEYTYITNYQLTTHGMRSSAIMKSDVAYSIDKKLDDAKAGTGKVRAYDPTGSNTCTTGNGSNPAANWILGKDNKSCRLIFTD